MEIDSNMKLGGVGRASPTNAVRESKTARDEAIFSKAAELDLALQNTPAVRDEVVARAKELVANTHYPPPEAISKISRLLAMEFDSPSSDSSTEQ